MIIEPGIINSEFDGEMLDPMMERSGDTAYAGMAEGVKKSTQKTYSKGKASDPRVIARKISKAVKSTTPKTRYRGGYMAKPAVWMRSVLGDRVWDKVAMMF